VQLIRRSGKPDTLTLSPATEQWLRHGYEQRMGTEAVRRDLGEILAHGEPERGMGQGEAAEQPDAQAFWDGEASPGAADRSQEAGADRGTDAAADPSGQGNGVVAVDFGGIGPDAA